MGRKQHPRVVLKVGDDTLVFHDIHGQVVVRALLKFIRQEPSRVADSAAKGNLDDADHCERRIGRAREVLSSFEAGGWPMPPDYERLDVASVPLPSALQDAPAADEADDGGATSPAAIVAAQID